MRQRMDGVGFQVQVRVFQVGNQQATVFRHAHDAAAEVVSGIWFSSSPTGRWARYGAGEFYHDEL